VRDGNHMCGAGGGEMCKLLRRGGFAGCGGEADAGSRNRGGGEEMGWDAIPSWS
jgi:hypothetical protein